MIGTAQEYAAQRSAEALRSLVAARAWAIRDGVNLDIDAEALVPGDVVRLEGGFRVPADMRILSAVGVDADESLLTGESVPVAKRAEPPASPDAPVAERAPMLFAGSLVSRGRATGVVVETGLRTELGKIATAVIGAPAGKPPLLLRMEKFSRKIAIAVAVTATKRASVSLSRILVPITLVPVKDSDGAWRYEARGALITNPAVLSDGRAGSANDGCGGRI